MRKLLCLLLPLLLLSSVSAAEPLAPTLRLQCLPSAGYGWTVELADEALLDVIDATKEQAPLKDEGVPNIGGAVTNVFRLVGKSAGSGTLTLTYGRPWIADEAKTVLTYAFTVDDALNVTITEQGYQTIGG